MPKVLFICTGNYYRSRYAEELFNYYAKQRNLDWSADSVGLKVAESRHVNVGSFSPHTYSALEGLGLTALNDKREPRQISDEDVKGADLAIALCEREHRPIVSVVCPHLEDKIKFWQIEDIQFEKPTVATKQIEEKVEQLVEELSA